MYANFACGNLYYVHVHHKHINIGTVQGTYLLKFYNICCHVIFENVIMMTYGLNHIINNYGSIN
jgi:hypothetical protein